MTYRSFFALVLVSCISVTAWGQADTLRGRNKSVVPVEVRSFSSNQLRVRMLGNGGGEPFRSFAFQELESLRFADGFEVQFRDGHLVRDNLLSAPVIRSSFLSVQAERVIDLTKDEVRRLYGDPLYRQMYRPYRTQFITGLGKAGLGAFGFFQAVRHNPSVHYTLIWASNSYDSDGNLSQTGHVRGYGDLYPGWMVAEAMLLGTTVAGVLDCTVSAIGLMRLNRHYKTLSGVSPVWANIELWGGAACTLAGAGLMTYCALQLNSHRQWSMQGTLRNGVIHYDEQKGSPADLSNVWKITVGGILTSLGLSAFQLGLSQVIGLRSTDNAPYAARVDIGPAPSGYGLRVVF